MWDHGSSSIGGICYDENYNMDCLDYNELKNAMNTYKDSTNNILEFIGFDACLMSNYGIAELFSNYAENMIASEELEPVGGWNYESALSKFGTDSFYQTILIDYEKKCKAGKKEYYTLSHINLKEFHKLQDSFNKFVTKLNNMAEDGLINIARCAISSVSFGANSQSEGYDNLIDLGDFSEQIGYPKLKEVLDEIIDEVHGEEVAGSWGLSIYYPMYDMDKVYKYVSLDGMENYRKFIATNYNDTDDKLIEFKDAGSKKGQELYVELTDKSNKYVRSIEYQIYQVKEMQVEETDAYETAGILLGTNSSVVKYGDGYVTSFEGKWMEWNGEVININVVDEKKDDVTIFSTPIYCNGEKGTVRFAFNDKDKSINIQGFLPEWKEKMASPRLMKLEEGDDITIRYKILDYNYDFKSEKGKGFKYLKNKNIEVVNVEDCIYQYRIKITDIYGNEYFSNEIVAKIEKGKIISSFISEGDEWIYKLEDGNMYE